MIEKDNLRETFTQRLHEALDLAGVRKYGRGSDIISKFKSHKVQITAQAVSKWLNSGSIPDAQHIALLADWLQVRREWLEYGILPREASAYGVSESDASLSARYAGKVPLVSWQDASRLQHMSDYELATITHKWINCPVDISVRGFALVVEGDSMTNHSVGPTYPHDSIIFVDPSKSCEPNDRVVALLAVTNQLTFKTLVVDSGKRYLKPINTQYPLIEIDENTKLYGKVLGVFIAE